MLLLNFAENFVAAILFCMEASRAIPLQNAKTYQAKTCIATKRPARRYLGLRQFPSNLERARDYAISEVEVHYTYTNISHMHTKLLRQLKWNLQFIILLKAGPFAWSLVKLFTEITTCIHQIRSFFKEI
jgi:hypothetical protein